VTSVACDLSAKKGMGRCDLGGERGRGTGRIKAQSGQAGKGRGGRRRRALLRLKMGRRVGLSIIHEGGVEGAGKRGRGGGCDNGRCGRDGVAMRCAPPSRSPLNCVTASP
jgi:hypothetical protein